MLESLLQTYKHMDDRQIWECQHMLLHDGETMSILQAHEKFVFLLCANKPKDRMKIPCQPHECIYESKKMVYIIFRVCVHLI